VTNAGIELFKAYSMLKNYNVWPVDGGLVEQSAKFLKCVEWCDLVNSRHEDIEKAIHERQKKQADLSAKALKGVR